MSNEKKLQVVALALAIPSVLVLGFNETIRFIDYWHGPQAYLVSPNNVLFFESKCVGEVPLCTKMTVNMSYYNKGEITYDEILLDESVTVSIEPKTHAGIDSDNTLLKNGSFELRPSGYVTVANPTLEGSCMGAIMSGNTELKDMDRLSICQVSSHGPRRIPALDVVNHETLFAPWPDYRNNIYQNYIPWETFIETVKPDCIHQQNIEVIEVAFNYKLESSEFVEPVRCYINPWLINDTFIDNTDTIRSKKWIAVDCFDSPAAFPREYNSKSICEKVSQ